MLSRWMPDVVYPSVHHLPWKTLSETYNTLIFDADNTLGPWQLEKLDTAALTLLKHLSDQGFSIGVLSNSRMLRRKDVIEAQLRQINIPLITNGKKPALSGYLEMMRLLNATPKQTIMIGDQWITDIIGAKRVGLKAIMVKPFSLKSEAWWARWRRGIEWLIFKVFYRPSEDKN